MTVTYRVGDTRTLIEQLPDHSVSLVTCSPPFVALRSYLPDGHPLKHAEIGSEPDPATFIDTLLLLVEQWGRVLTPWGSIAIELGDTYSGSGGAGGDYTATGLRAGQQPFTGSAARRRQPANTAHRLHPDGTVKTTATARRLEPKNTDQLLPATGGRGWPRPKCLALVPQAFAMSLAYGRNVLRSPMTAHDVLRWVDELRAHGYSAERALATVGGWVAEHGAQHTFEPWLVRNMVVWHRPNPPVGALGDKYRPATSYITVATRSPRRWFDLTAVRSDPSPNTHARTAKGIDHRDTTGKAAADGRGGGWSTLGTMHLTGGPPPLDTWFDEYDHAHDVWSMTSQPSSLAHYAMWPARLADRLVQSMCPTEVCTTCGEPRRRIEHATNAVGAAHRHSRNDPTVHSKGDDMLSSTLVPDVSIRHTTGWTHCGHDTFTPGVVLDPFAGTGTTLAVAHLRGRDAIGFDIDDRNRTLYPARLAECRRALFGTKPTPAGQLDIFADVSESA
jgi:hypothetical protein